MALFLGPPRWAGAGREPLVFMVQGKINKGRHIDHPAGRNSIRTKQCPPPPSPHYLLFYVFCYNLPLFICCSVVLLTAIFWICFAESVWHHSSAGLRGASVSVRRHQFPDIVLQSFQVSVSPRCLFFMDANCCEIFWLILSCVVITDGDSSERLRLASQFWVSSSSLVGEPLGSSWHRHHHGCL